METLPHTLLSTGIGTRVKLLIVSQYFWPENFRINDLAQFLVQQGHTVSVLTGRPNYPEGRLYPGYRLFRGSRDSHAGIKIRRVPLVPRGGGGAFRLAVNYLSFAVCATALIPFYCRDDYDAILVYEPSPITVALPAMLLRALRRTPAAMWILDLWPETLVATGSVRSRSILGVVGALVRFIYRRLDLLLVQSRAFIPHIEGQGEAFGQKTRYFPASAEAMFVPQPSSRELPGLVKGRDDFWIMIAGNVGVSQAPGLIVDTANLLKGDRGIKWIVVGDGRMLEWMKNEVDERGLQDRVHFLGRHPVEAMPGFFAAADVMLVALRKEPIFSLTIPGRIQSYLAAGRPIVAALDGEGARVVEEARAGISCVPEDAGALAESVLAVYRTPREEREAMGRRGREYYDEHFDRKMLASRLEAWLEELALRRRVA